MIIFTRTLWVPVHLSSGDANAIFSHAVQIFLRSKPLLFKNEKQGGILFPTNQGICTHLGAKLITACSQVPLMVTTLSLHTNIGTIHLARAHARGGNMVLAYISVQTGEVWTSFFVRTQNKFLLKPNNKLIWIKWQLCWFGPGKPSVESGSLRWVT